MSEITAQAYADEIEALAKSITAESREHGQDIHDALHETIDGHQWVNNHCHMQVLQHSDHENEMWEQGCAPEKVQAIHDVLMPATYFAMRADVAAHADFDADPDEDEICEAL